MKESYFRIKMSFPFENEQGKTEKVKAEDLVYAVNYTDAEKTAMALIANQNRDQYGDVEYEIVKTKVSDLRPSKLLMVNHEATINKLVYAGFDDDEYSSDGLYQVKVRYEDGLNDDGDRTFKTETIWVIAASATHAQDIAERRYDGLTPKIKKVEFDKTESIIVPESFFNITSED